MRCPVLLLLCSLVLPAANTWPTVAFTGSHAETKQLVAANNAGFTNARAVQANYRILLERVSENDVEASKLLRKPLNVQSGKEDGRQGGRRYNPNERGYEIPRRWVLDAAALKRGGVGSND